MGGGLGRVSLLALLALAASDDAQPSLTPVDQDMAKLNDYIQAERVNEINMETLYGDLQRRFTEVKADWSRADAERLAMRKALRTAQAQAAELHEANKRLTGLLNEVRAEQSKMARAKATVLAALGLDETNSTALARVIAAGRDDRM